MISKDNVFSLFACVLAVAIVFIASNAFAITAPTTGGFMYDLYDIGVVKILKGAPGFVIGVGAIAFGGSQLFKAAIIPGILSLLGGGIVLKADSVVTTLGLMVI